MKNIEQRIKDHYQSQSFPEDLIEEMIADDATKRSNNRLLAPILYAFCLILSVLAVYHLWRPSLESEIVAQVYKNHIKQLGPEILSSDFVEIQQGLDRLDFVITPTQTEMLTNFSVNGGRYCSIREELAAQISLTDPKGLPCTLYIAPLTTELAKVSPGIYTVDGGGRVQIWQDQHRLLALASNS